jgi:L-amino acid N-acyltransferase YncA
VSVTIRDAVPADARAIAEVHVRSWQAAYRGELPDDYLDGLSVDERERMWTAVFAEPEPRAAVFVATDDEGRVVGFTGVGPSRDDDASTSTGEVRTIYLRPEWFGKGVGRDLFARANERLRELGFSRATLWVLATNERSRRFYEKAGWVFDGTESAHQSQCLNMPIVRSATEL